MRSARTSRILAFVWEVSVTMPAWEPVSEIARWPRSLIAIAQSAHEIRSPVERSMSISRGSGNEETSSAIAISSSVVFPRADRTATTRRPASRWATIRLAARLIRSASATEVPPNFITTVGGADMSQEVTRCRRGAPVSPRPGQPLTHRGDRRPPARSPPTRAAGSASSVSTMGWCGDRHRRLDSALHSFLHRSLCLGVPWV